MNKNLNFLKGLACIAVLHMHTCSDSLFSSVLNCLCRFAIPLFFIISGFYGCDTEGKIEIGKIKNKIKKNLSLGIKVSIFYFILTIVDAVFRKQQINIIFFKRYFGIKDIINFILFNQVSFCGVLWFIFALCYCYVVLLLVNRYKLFKIMKIAVVALLALHILGRGTILYFNLIPENINIIYFRNFLFMGIPFFFIGYFIRIHSKELDNRYTNHQLIAAIIIGLIISCIERRFVALEIFVGTIIAVIAMFIYAQKNPNKKMISIIEKIGERYYLQVYIMHIAVLMVWGRLLSILKINNKIIDYFRPFIILVVVLLMVDIYRLLIKLLKCKGVK